MEAEVATVGETLSELSVLDSSGDSRMQWDPNNPMQVAAARARFDELKAKRYVAYKLDASGSQGEKIDEFDPTAQRLLLHGQMVGG